MQNIVVLTGKSLSIDDIVNVAKNNCTVSLSAEAVEAVKKSRQAILNLANSTTPIYGLNTGLGANKDRSIGEESFAKFNKDVIMSHSIGMGEMASSELVRATMLCRINGFLNGNAGISPEVVKLMTDMLNLKVHPIIYEKGSVGMSDLANMSGIGMALIGEGKCELGGKIMPSSEALKLAGLSPVKLGVKEALPILSSNMFSLAKAALVFYEIEHLLNTADLTYAMGLEAMNYKLSMLEKKQFKNRTLKGQICCVDNLLKYLHGSKRFDEKTERLSGSLSFKSSYAVHGDIRESFDYAKNMLSEYINYSDDCPCVDADTGSIIHSAGFIITKFALACEMLKMALSHLAKVTAYRSMSYSIPEFSLLPRFLKNREDTIAFSTMQKDISAVYSEIRHLANPVSMDYLSTANHAEDYGTNTAMIVGNLEKIADLLCYSFALEALHAAQAYDLSEKPSGEYTKYAYGAIRKNIEFVDTDNHDLSEDIHKTYMMIKNRELFEGEV